MKGASSLTGKCHTWDQKADGYIKAEGINAVMLKRLDDAIRDGDPIRAVIRGTATNSDGRTPGIASEFEQAFRGDPLINLNLYQVQAVRLRLRPSEQRIATQASQI